MDNNNKFSNYYNILGIENTATDDEIYNAYRLKIGQFNHLPFHTHKMINEIKLLKEALYVLANEKKRKKYDIKFNKTNKYIEDSRIIDNTKICDRLFSITF